MYDTLKRFITCIVFALLVFLIIFCAFKYFTCTNDTRSQDVNSTIQQLTTDYKSTQRELQQAGERNKDAQNTVDRISDLTTESQQLLDRLQAELDEIAKSNGLSTEREEDNGKTT